MSTEVETERRITAIARHSLIDAKGQPVEEMEEASGIRYQDIASGETFDYVLSKNGPAKTMLALFGARTLATNVASASRQKDGNSADQLAAIRERFALIDGGQWVDRTREFGPRYDLPTVATAIVNVLVALGKVPNTDEEKGKRYSGYLAKMEGDKTTVSAYLQVDGVQAEYKRLRGTKVMSADDLLSAVPA